MGATFRAIGCADKYELNNFVEDTHRWVPKIDSAKFDFSLGSTLRVHQESLGENQNSVIVTFEIRPLKSWWRIAEKYPRYFKQTCL